MKFSTLKTYPVNGVRSYFHRDWDTRDIANFGQLWKYFLLIVRKVYLSMVFALASSAFGSYLSNTGYIGCTIATLGALMTGICYTFVAPWEEKEKVCLLVAGTFFGGAAIGPWFTWLIVLDTGFQVTALLGISLGFGCFWAASGATYRFYQVYLRGMFFCAIVIMTWLRAASAFFGGDSAIWLLELYVAILCFMGYVAVQSLELVFTIRQGNHDYVKHAVTLFINAPAVILNVIRLMRREALLRLVWNINWTIK